MEGNFCLAFLQSNQRKGTKARKCSRPNYGSTHNVLLHGAEWVFPSAQSQRTQRAANVNSLATKTSMEKDF